MRFEGMPSTHAQCEKSGWEPPFRVSPESFKYLGAVSSKAAFYSDLGFLGTTGETMGVYFLRIRVHRVSMVNTVRGIDAH